MKKCMIAGAGNWYSYQPKPRKNVFVIAVDGGYRELSERNIKMDLIVGDFDSLKKSEIVDSIESDKIIELPKEKDDTDTLFAIRSGLKEGLTEFHIFGGTGGRFSHTLANIQCLGFLSQHGAKGFIYGEDYIMTCINNGEIEFDEEQRGYVSVFSSSDISKGVYIDGLKYELVDAEISNTFPIGVSNEFIGKKSKISVREGRLIIIFPNEKRRIEI